MVARMPSDCQYVRIVNFGYYFIFIYCVVTIMHRIIIIWFYATIVVNNDE